MADMVQDLTTLVDAEEVSQRVVLHVGCGPANPERLHERFRGPDWREIRIDVDPAVMPDHVASVASMPMIADGSVAAIWSSHNLEHLEAHEVPLALAEYRRVLQPDGIALITLPDMAEVARLVLADRLDHVLYESPAGPVTARDMIWGLGSAIEAGNRFMAHRTGFTERTLAEALIRAGFGEVRIWSRDLALWAEARPSRRAGSGGDHAIPVPRAAL